MKSNDGFVNVIVGLLKVKSKQLFYYYLYTLKSNNWKDEDDGKIERELIAVEQPFRRDIKPQVNSIDFKNSFNEFDQILNKSSAKNREIFKNDKEIYKIILTNSDLNIPGIEPNLTIQLYGKNSRTGNLILKAFENFLLILNIYYFQDRIPLRKSKIESRNTRKNSELSYEIETLNVDEIVAIKIGLDNSRPNLGNLNNTIFIT